LSLAGELCQTVIDELLFYLAYLLGVGKIQDLSSKIWQILGDARRKKTKSRTEVEQADREKTQMIVPEINKLL
jgi:hypothetical protein